MADAPSILFVCMGNICRSPTGEGVMRKLLADRDLTDRVKIDSAGTISYHEGHPADARMRQHASARGYHLDSIARQVRHADFERFDLIVAMDRENHEDLMRRVPDEHREKIQLLSDFLDGDWPGDVPDPYYGGADGFERVLDMIEAACPKILESVLDR
ncbi:MAG: low molecular weight protein-tyrosine-phosphatase [Phycisphaeraceae bacterium]|nr:low molecular weight protein-tyrosine-phosphatase [Phycisphaeraceae bacterium]